VIRGHDRGVLGTAVPEERQTVDTTMIRNRYVALLVAAVVHSAACRTSSGAGLDFHAWGWEDAKDARAQLEHYRHIVLACVFEDGWEDRGPHRYALYRFKATVVRVYKGDRRVSERVSFVHGLDDRAPAAPASNTGKLMFVFTNERREINLETGDFRDYDAELERVLVSTLRALHVATESGRAQEGGEVDGPKPIVLKALAKLGHLEGHLTRNTFYIPRKPNAGDLFVIYWKEKNVLFYYPKDGAPEIAEHPSLVRGHEYRVEEATFRRTGDSDYATSTYLESYGWAMDRLIDAVVNGRRYDLEYQPQRVSRQD
jgi:hypothetical protein